MLHQPHPPPQFIVAHFLAQSLVLYPQLYLIKLMTISRLVLTVIIVSGQLILIKISLSNFIYAILYTLPALTLNIVHIYIFVYFYLYFFYIYIHPILPSNL